MALLEMQPRPILLAAIAAALAATLCLMLDVSDVATPAVWHVGRGRPPSSEDPTFASGCCNASWNTRPNDTTAWSCTPRWSN
jgi:hypothetical protein